MARRPDRTDSPRLRSARARPCGGRRVSPVDGSRRPLPLRPLPSVRDLAAASRERRRLPRARGACPRGSGRAGALRVGVVVLPAHRPRARRREGRVSRVAAPRRRGHGTELRRDPVRRPRLRRPLGAGESADPHPRDRPDRGRGAANDAVLLGLAGVHAVARGPADGPLPGALAHAPPRLLPRGERRGDGAQDARRRERAATGRDPAVRGARRCGLCDGHGGKVAPRRGSRAPAERLRLRRVLRRAVEQRHAAAPPLPRSRDRHARRDRVLALRPLRRGGAAPAPRRRPAAADAPLHGGGGRLPRAPSRRAVPALPRAHRAPRPALPRPGARRAVRGRPLRRPGRGSRPQHRRSDGRARPPRPRGADARDRDQRQRRRLRGEQRGPARTQAGDVRRRNASSDARALAGPDPSGRGERRACDEHRPLPDRARSGGAPAALGPHRRRRGHRLRLARRRSEPARPALLLPG